MNSEYLKMKINKVLPFQPQETEIGNCEYKRKINLFKTNKGNKSKLEKRRTQMLYRIYEGKGRATYYIGVEDSGEPLGITYDELQQTLQNLRYISDGLGAIWTSVEIYDGISSNSYTGKIHIYLNNQHNFSVL